MNKELISKIIRPKKNGRGRIDLEKISISHGIIYMRKIFDKNWIVYHIILSNKWWINSYFIICLKVFHRVWREEKTINLSKLFGNICYYIDEILALSYFKLIDDCRGTINNCCYYRFVPLTVILTVEIWEIDQQDALLIL